jgi:hypothetical protein
MIRLAFQVTVVNEISATIAAISGRNGGTRPVEKEVYTVSEAAEQVPYSEKRIREFCQHRYIRATQASPGGKWLIPASEIEAMKAGLPRRTKGTAHFDEAEPEQRQHDAERRHDERVFREADALMNEADLRAMLRGIRSHFYDSSQLTQFIALGQYLGLEGNTYLNPTLRDLATGVLETMRDLEDVLGIASRDIQRQGDRTVFQIDARAGGVLRDGEEFACGDWDRVWQTVDSCENAYVEYRAAVRNILGDEWRSGAATEPRSNGKAGPPAENDPLVLEARRRHFEDLCNVIETFAEEVDNVAGFIFEMNPIDSGSGSLVPWKTDGWNRIEIAGQDEEDDRESHVPWVRLRTEQGQIAEIELGIETSEPLFGCLRSHLDASLWGVYQEWKQLVRQVWQEDLRPSREKQVDFDGYRELILRADATSDRLTNELALARHRRVFDGRCAACP